MEADFERYFDWLRAAGVRFRVASDCVVEPDHDGPLVVGEGTVRRWTEPGPFDEVRDPAEGRAADHATASVVAALIRRPPKGPVWEVGCGTGVLVVAAARFGFPVIATDVDRRSLELSRQTCAGAGVEADLREGSLLDPIRPDEKAELVVANLPHKPVPVDSKLRIAQNGGPDGARIHCAFAEQAAERLEPGSRVLFFLHSLPNRVLLRTYAAAFDLELVAAKRRWFQPREYGPLLDHFRRREGSFVCSEGERCYAIAGVWEATRR